MAIQPIDLQTLYSQIDKIGKNQVQQQLAAQTAREAEMNRNKLQAEEKQKTVQEADAGDERAGTVHEKDDSSDSHSGGKKRSADSNSSDNAGDTDRDSEIIRDPALGNKVDISG